MGNRARVAAALWVVGALVAVGQADQISLNFSENSGNQAFVGGELIGPLNSNSSFWNTTNGQPDLVTGTLFNLIDDTGANTGASVTWSSSNVWWNNDGTADDQARLAVGYLDDGDPDGDGIGVSVTFSGIPYADYTVYGLLASDQAAEYSTRDFTVNGNSVFGAATAPAYGSMNASQNALGQLWSLADGTSRGNFWVTAASGSTLTITAPPRDGANRASISAVIISTVPLPEPLPALSIDRDTGSISILNEASVSAQIAGYSILSSAGTLVGSNWTPIAGNYDANGNGSVSSDEWLVFSSSATDLSEGTLGTGTLGPNSSVDLGAGVWGKYFNESELVFEYLDVATGEVLRGPVRFSGNNGQAFAQGDLNFDGALDAVDWPIVRDAFNTTLSGVTLAQAYALGDVTGDLQVDYNDLVLFKTLFDAANGAGAFNQMVPEPGTLALAGLACLALVGLRRRIPAVAVCLICVSLLGGGSVLADPIPVNNFSFEDAALGAGAWSNCIDVICGDPDPEYWQDEPLNGGDAFAEYIEGFSAEGTHHMGMQVAGKRVRQTLSGVSLQPNFIYTFTPAVGNRSGFGGATAAFGLGIDNVPLGPLQTTSVDAIPAGTFSDRRYVYITGSAPQAGDLQVILGTEGPGRSHYDNIRLDGSPVAQYSDLLSLQVNETTGLVRLQNAAGFVEMDIDYYEVRSSAGSLNLTGWNSLQDQDYEGNGTPGTGNGWEELGNLDTTLAAEFYLQGSSVLAGGSTDISLGNLFNPASAKDLRLFYRLADGRSFPGPVFYVTGGITGDFNSDGLWNCDDINALVGEIVAGTNDGQFDMNGDGSVTLADITAAGDGWLAVGGANNPGATGGNPFLPGDANLDGSVDVSDFNIWNSKKFTATPEWCNGDFNADGSVDVSDFNTWNSNKFQSSGGLSAVPEPAAAAWLVVLGWLLAVRRRP